MNSLFLVFPEILNKLGDLIVSNDEVLSSKYFVQKSNIPVKVEWLKNDKVLIIDNLKFTTSNNAEENSFSFNIQNCSIKDAGKYSICVSNCFGKSISDFRLLIRCKLKFFCIFY